MSCVVTDDGGHAPGRLRVGMCERHYRRHKKHGSPAAPVLVDNLARFKVLPNGCHEWDGPTYPNGYGKMSREAHGTRLPHRAAYIEHVGPIPDGLDVDHRCHVAPCEPGPQCPHRRCMNPAHLQPVPRVVNLERGHAMRIHCNGRRERHDITIPGALLPGTHRCRACFQARQLRGGRARTARQKAARAGQ